MDVMQIRRMLMAIATGGGQALKIEAGTYTPSTDENVKDAHISHSLGVVPDFVIAMSDTIDGSLSTTKYIVNAYCSKINVTNINLSGGYEAFYMGTQSNGTSNAWITYENLSTAKFMHENNFEIPYYSSTDKLKAGVTYHWVVGKYE